MSGLRLVGLIGLVLALAGGAAFAPAHRAAVAMPRHTTFAQLPGALRTAVSGAVGRQDSAYAIKALQNGAFAADAGGLRYSLGPSASTITSQSGKRWTLALSATGPARIVQPHRNELRIARSGVTAWYLNGPLGLQQGWTVARRASRAGRLTLAFSQRGALRGVAGADGTSLRLGDGLSFAGLTAFDARGHALRARFANGQGHGLRIVVDDHAATYPVTIDPFVQQQHLVPSGGVTADRFGYSVALSATGSVALIGAFPVGASKGSAYVFARNGSVWSGTPLVPSNTNNNDGFGRSVALSAAGDTAIVGAPHGALDKGAAFVFTGIAGGWTQQGQLMCDSCANNTLFGTAVALSSDGGTALVGLPAYQSSKGAAVLFTRSGGHWTQQQAGLEATGGAANDLFGGAVALSSDGNVALIGASGVSGRAGAAYAFNHTGGFWSQKKLTATAGAANNAFGSAVALSANGGILLIGAPGEFNKGAAYIFTASGGGGYAQSQRFTSSGGNAYADFGAAVSLASDGATALVGARDVAGSKGVAYAFTSSAGSWTQRQITATGSANNDRFGSSVAVSGNGMTALFGATGVSNSAGAGYVFARSGTTWAQQQPPPLVAVGGSTGDGFGSSVKISADGNTAFVGAPGTSGARGAIYIFGRSGSTWTQLQQYPGLAANGGLGHSIAISGDGNTAIVYPLVLTRSGGSWNVQGQLPTIGPVPQTFSDPRGPVAIALSANGNTALVGHATTSVNSQAYYVIDRGNAYIYVRNGTTWTQQTQLDPGPASPASGLGFAVALSADGTVAAVGAPGTLYPTEHDVGLTPQKGAVYVFGRNGTGAKWTTLQKLAPTGGALSDHFGISVAMTGDGSYFLVGADGASGFRGAAYVFTHNGKYSPSPGSWTQRALTTPGLAPDDDFGIAVALTADGATALVGAYGLGTKHGAAYVFGRTGTTWAKKQQLAAPDATGRFDGVAFGLSLSMSADGTKLLVSGARSAFVYAR